MSRNLLLASLTACGLASGVSAQYSPPNGDQPYIPPAPYHATAHPHGFWYGSDSLWTYVRFDGFVTSSQDRISAKLVYWRVGFDWLQEPEPELAVGARRIDAAAEPVVAPKAYGVKFPDDETPGSMAMMTGISIPVAGCWEIEATYRGQILRYVVQVRKSTPRASAIP